MTPRFTVEALTHIADIHSYIAEHSQRAAAHVVGRIFAEADRLAEFPHLGRAGRVSGTYERIVPGLPFIIVYQFDNAYPVLVLAVYHGAQGR
jgi:toxin ParE1/3/4